ncbi:MAG: hypothetical protein NVSMB17_00700 [Candidatus Dormibacteria bacterium]
MTWEVATPVPTELTARELEIARMLVAGLSDAAIASQLEISTRTVSKHLENLRAKLGLHSRWQVADWIRAEGLSG